MFVLFLLYWVEFAVGVAMPLYLTLKFITKEKEPEEKTDRFWLVYWICFTVVEWFSIYFTNSIFLIARISLFSYFSWTGKEGSDKSYEIIEKMGLHKAEEVSDKAISWIKVKFDIKE
ncbi:unnamed protein product [Blepharisma stoltei]|uniref:HVA22-like protein n=1 Tax=Blepharisma stoltei TaxID=1481888 RepID=A0AAU9JEW9_9CILI|nr:unnamed protein product [Blepharisma stoltei]